MGKRAPVNFAELPVRVRYVARPDTNSMGDAIEALRAIGRRIALKPSRHHSTEEAIPCPS